MMNNKLIEDLKQYLDELQATIDWHFKQKNIYELKAINLKEKIAELEAMNQEYK